MGAGPVLWILDDGRVLGGGQLFALRLLRHLRDAGEADDARLVCPDDGDLMRRARSEGVQVSPATFPAPTPSGIPAVPRALVGLRRLLSRAPRGAAVVAGSARCQALAVPAMEGLRRDLDLVHLMHEQESSARVSARFVHRHTGRVVAVGANTAAAYRSALPGARVSHVNNFLLAADYGRLGALRGEHEAGAPPVLGVLGRLIPEKGISELVGELAGSIESWARLRVAGAPQDPAYARSVEQRAADLGLDSRVELLGHVSDVDAFLASIDLLVVPSTGHEAQPTVILEGLAAGIGVVVRRPIFSPDFDGLSVQPYADGSDLPAALEAANRAAPVPIAALLARFGPDQAVRALTASPAGGAPEASRGR